MRAIGLALGLASVLGSAENVPVSSLSDAASDPSYALRGAAAASGGGATDYCPQTKLVKVPQELTDCGFGGGCDPVSIKMTTAETYSCLGQKWDMPTSPKPAAAEQVPRIVHVVLSDHGTRAFDWTCWVAIKAAQIHLKPTKIMVHILDNVEPWSGWWTAVKAMPEVEVMPFFAKDVPAKLNGFKVAKPAHLSDFRRFQMLHEYGGVYIDTDHIFLRSPAALLRFKSVWGRQALNEVGHQVAIGAMFTTAKNPLFKALYEQMKKVFDGGWDTHSIKMVDKYFKTHSPAGNLILPCESPSPPPLPSAPPPSPRASAAARTARLLHVSFVPVPGSLLTPSPPLPSPPLLPPRRRRADGALFPFSWKRGDLCCDYWYHKGKEPTSLFEGKGWDWSSAYSFHLFHSQSESFFKNDDAYSIKQMLKGTSAERKNWPNALALALGEDFTELYELMDKHLDNDAKIRDGAIKANIKKWKIDMNA